MRTTVTLDDDLAARLKRAAHERGIPFKQVINEAIRRGLSGNHLSARPYRVPRLRLRARPGVDIDKALRLAAALDDQVTIEKQRQGR